MTVQEYRRKCKVCGKIWCYTDEDLKNNLANATVGLLSSVSSLGNMIGGSTYQAFEMSKKADRAINKNQDFMVCPECHSRDNEPYYTEEDKIRMAEEEHRKAEEERRIAEEKRRREEERVRIAEEMQRQEQRKIELKKAYWAEHKAEKEALISKREYAKKKLSELGLFAKKEKQELEKLIKAIDYELEKERG